MMANSCSAVRRHGPSLVPSLVFWILVSAIPSHAAQIDNGTSVEGCIGCHAAGTALPVGNINDVRDAHYADLNPAGPQTRSGYRQLEVILEAVDITGASAVVTFAVNDESGTAVTNLFAADGRLTIAKLVPGAVSGDPTEWQTLVSAERFTSSGGLFETLGEGAYRYTSAFDPTTVPVAPGDTLRGVIQISASDLPTGNGWCDFDASLAAPSICPGSPSSTRDIIPTATCNGCHGVTSDAKLSFHGGGRTEVEYCVACHNPGIGETDMTSLIHKIHYGAGLTQGFRRWSHVNFTRDSDNCTSCHTGGGADENNWATVPYRAACGSCHDDVNFDTGEGHGAGGVQTTNRFCANCHPASGPWTASQLPVSTVHQGVARAAEAGRYRGATNGFFVDRAVYDADGDSLTIDYSVARDGAKMTLQSDPAWNNGSAALRLTVAWSSSEYTNEGSESSPAPAQPIRIDALDVGGAVGDLGDGDYRAVLARPSGAFGVVTVTLEGRPVADVRGDGTYVALPVQTAVADVSVERRLPASPRRAVVDVAKCNACHDVAGAGLAFHGNNRTSEIVACATCHNADATDIAQRPADPATTPDGKREESIDLKRMIHGIHAGRALENGLVLYGAGGASDFSDVGFVGNNANCLTCHLAGTYSTEDASATLSSTIDIGMDVTDPFDDLNISRITATCSSCHDGARARQHMVLNGGSFMALDEDIAINAPEAGRGALALAAMAVLGSLCRFRHSA